MKCRKVGERSVTQGRHHQAVGDIERSGCLWRPLAAAHRPDGHARWGRQAGLRRIR